MKLIMGLGNIGDEYKNTRHNLGFLVIDKLQKEWNLSFKNKNSFSYATHFVNQEKIIIAKPILYMNNSGRSLLEIISYFNIGIEDIIIFVDDKDQSMANIKIVNKGGHGGQNGIRDIIEKLGTNNFLRVKCGIGFNKNIPTKDYVLGKWSNDQKLKLENFLSKLVNIAKDFSVGQNFVELTNTYNFKNNYF